MITEGNTDQGNTDQPEYIRLPPPDEVHSVLDFAEHIFSPPNPNSPIMSNPEIQALLATMMSDARTGMLPRSGNELAKLATAEDAPTGVRIVLSKRLLRMPRPDVALSVCAGVVREAEDELATGVKKVTFFVKPKRVAQFKALVDYAHALRGAKTYPELKTLVLSPPPEYKKASTLGHGLKHYTVGARLVRACIAIRSIELVSRPDPVSDPTEDRTKAEDGVMDEEMKETPKE